MLTPRSVLFYYIEMRIDLVFPFYIYPIFANELIKKSNERLKKIAEENPDKIKQYRRNAYLKQKEKKKQKELENKNNEIILIN